MYACRYIQFLSCLETSAAEAVACKSGHRALRALAVAVVSDSDTWDLLASPNPYPQIPKSPFPPADRHSRRPQSFSIHNIIANITVSYYYYY